MTPITTYLSSPAECQGPMEAWDFGSGMCRPLAMAGMPMRMLMVHGNAFGAYVSTQGPRGQREFAAPHMVMIDAGQSVGAEHYVSAELMATGERWTFPEAGYPELLQIGEHNRQGAPFLDAQHPHNSPVMGLTLRDRVRLPGAHNHLQLTFAPRGETTDGPVAFMHRPTGMVNPDAPLGHHVGQDVGHITSTVLAASLTLGAATYEVSTFNGREPEPTKVDLPLSTPDSWAGRVIYQLMPQVYAMASAAYVHGPEPDERELKFLTRYSASIYSDTAFKNGLKLSSAFIYGVIHNYDHTSLLRSYGAEFLVQGYGPSLWGRVEYLQRTPEELRLATTGDEHRPLWLTAATLGCTQSVGQLAGLSWGLGGSVTKDFVPAEVHAVYAPGAAAGGLWSAKVFVQLSGMHMQMEK